MDLKRNTFRIFLEELEVDGQVYKFFDITKLNDEKYAMLPYSIRVLLEAAVRNCDEIQVTSRDVKNLLNWPETHKKDVEVPFMPARVLLQDFTGVPALIDFATLRDTISDLGGQPTSLNPRCPVDLVMDQSLQVDYSKKLIINTSENVGSKSCPPPSTPSSCCLSARSNMTNSSVGSLNNMSNHRSSISRTRPGTPSSYGAHHHQHQMRPQSRGGFTMGQQPNLANTSHLSTSNSSFASDSTLTGGQQQQQQQQQQVQVDVGFRECPFHLVRTECAESIEKGLDLEFERNRERFQFLKWAANAFKNMSIIPPGNGLSHQINLEHLSRFVFVTSPSSSSSSSSSSSRSISMSSTASGDEDSSSNSSLSCSPPSTTSTNESSSSSLIYPDSVVGTDSHTNAVNGTGVLSWTVGGIEAESVMLGQSTRVVLPRVVGYRLYGKLNHYCTSTDVVIAITKNLRQIGVVNKFVEFFGPGVDQLSMADRITIANMCPEYGALVAFFAFDHKTAQYLIQTGHNEKTVELISKYLKSVQLFRENNNNNKNNTNNDSTHSLNDEFSTSKVVYSEVYELDLSTILPCVSGPKRSLDKISLAELKTEFLKSLTSPTGFNGFGLNEESAQRKRVKLTYEGEEYTLENGSIVLASITSCTNSSNPSVMLAAGMLARKALDAGLTIRPYIRTNISPGSGLVIDYLTKSGVIASLEALGFKLVGYGCGKCIENATSLPEPVLDAIEKNNELITVGMLSGNRNFESRIHPATRASYLASPPLVVAYALAGRVDIDFNTEPIGVRASDQKPVFLKDIWPSRAELHELEANFVLPQVYFKVFDKINIGCKQWEGLDYAQTDLYPWNFTSTYIKKPPFLDNVWKRRVESERSNEQTRPRDLSIKNAHVLLYLGDSITTDHISPAGSIARHSPAARYLLDRGLAPRDFNSYGSRRGNDAVMSRGTFANLRLVNKLLAAPSGGDTQPPPAPRTIYMPNGREMDIFDASEMYKRDGSSLIVIAGKDYGSGSPRDWAVKGPLLLGIKAIIAESFEKIHRSNLISMGILPLRFLDGQNGSKLKLTGREKYTIRLDDENLSPRQQVQVETDTGKKFNVILCIDSSIELTYYKHGGLLNYAVQTNF